MASVAVEIEADNNESDEAFARRLQAQELGTGPDQATPLMRANGENPTVINARLNELSNARGTLFAVLCINVPQICAAFFVLCIHWGNDAVEQCPDVYQRQWKIWAIVSALRMFIYTSIVVIMHVYKPYFDERPHRQARLSSLRNIVDASGLIWFVIGNIWVFGDDLVHCVHPQKSPIYDICVAMLIINYIQICLPCIVAILLIPVFCFCMPCLIRVLARMQTTRAPVGATDETIRKLPTTIVTEEHIMRLGDNSTCPICLTDMAVGDEARLLQCKHIFHKQCVDEWLRVNASCPTCRLSILAGSDGIIRVEQITTRTQRPVHAHHHHHRHHHHGNESFGHHSGHGHGHGHGQTPGQGTSGHGDPSQHALPSNYNGSNIQEAIPLSPIHNNMGSNSSSRNGYTQLPSGSTNI